MTSNQKSHIFSADRPILTALDDLLGRAPFAKRLAEAVSAWRGSDSLVVGLYGTWGIGKSSIKNMVVEALSTTEHRPHVVEYNPWQWSGQDQLAKGFFSEIGKTLGRGQDARAARKREYAWRRYAAQLGIPLLVADATRGFATWILTVGGVVVAISPVAAAYLPRAAAYVQGIFGGVILFALAAFMRFAQSLSERFAAIASARVAQLEQKTLSEHKSELKSLLANLRDPVLVVVDDIDRLSTDDIRLLFQLVKANADFPNLTYLLLFQRDIVATALADPVGNANGDEFLQKIVQVGFDVPPLEEERLFQALFRGLDRVLEDEGLEKKFDPKHWQEVFPGLRGLFSNLRDVARFLGSFAFHASLFRNGRSSEVNPVDLIALEAVRVFEPTVYSRLQAGKSLLTSAGSSYGGQRDVKASTAAVQGIVECASTGRREAIDVLLSALFPNIRTLRGGASYGDGYADSWFRATRVCHAKTFDRYFLLALPVGDISQADIDYLIENSADKELISQRMRSYIETDRITAVLERLEFYKQTLPKDNIRAFIGALMDIGDALPERSANFFVTSADMHASRFIHWSLKTLEDARAQSAVFSDACLSSSGIALPIGIVAEQEAKKHQAENPDWYYLSDVDIERCRGALLERIRHLAEHGLEQSFRLSYILFRWKEWTDPSEAKAWVQDFLKRDGGAATLLSKFVNKGTSSTMFGGGATTVRYSISLATLREFVSVEEIEAALVSTSGLTRSASEEVAVEAFRKALRREAAGKPERDFDFDDD